MDTTQILLLCVCGAVFVVIAVIAAIGNTYSLKGIPNKPVGNGQHGTARFATAEEVNRTYKHIPYLPDSWRNSQRLPSVDGLIVGCVDRGGHMTAMVDDSDIHTLMIGASGVGKTANFLYPNIEYCCAAGMSFVTTDSKGDLYRNTATIREIKWRCINRLQYGKKICHSSPTVDEEPLHRAIVGAINSFCDVKGDIGDVLRQSIAEVLDPNMNGSVLAAQQRIDELAGNIDELLKLATVPESADTAMSDIERFSEEMKSLREFIESEKAKTATDERDSEQLNAVLNRLKQEDFKLTEYDDIAVRQLVEKVTVKDKDTITVTFKGGFDISESLHQTDSIKVENSIYEDNAPVMGM